MRKLQMDFQPLFMSGLCLRRTDRSLWSGIQKNIVPAKRPVCSICGFVAETKRSLIHADEVWTFPEPPKVFLIDIRPLCVQCHDAKDYADFLRRINQGKASPSRSTSIIDHYCAVNGFSADDFDADFKEALARVDRLNFDYKWNFDRNVVVDYGKWDRPADRPRLSDAEKKLVRALYRDREDPIEAGSTSLATFASAIRHLQSLHISERADAIREMQDFVLEETEGDGGLSEADEGVQFAPRG